jgi:hypothetical protein
MGPCLRNSSRVGSWRVYGIAFEEEFSGEDLCLVAIVGKYLLRGIFRSLRIYELHGGRDTVRLDTS